MSFYAELQNARDEFFTDILEPVAQLDLVDYVDASGNIADLLTARLPSGIVAKISGGGRVFLNGVFKTIDQRRLKPLLDSLAEKSRQMQNLFVVYFARILDGDYKELPYIPPDIQTKELRNYLILLATLLRNRTGLYLASRIEITDKALFGLIGIFLSQGRVNRM